MTRSRLVLAAALGCLLNGLPALGAEPGLAVPAPGTPADPVRASLRLDRAFVSPGGAVDAILVLEHAPGWHSYGSDPGAAGYPTRLEWELPAGLSAGPIRWPPAQAFKTGGIESRGYSGRVELRTRLSASPDIVPGSVLRIRATASYLACKESCLPGDASFSLSLAIAAGSASPLRDFLLALGGALLGGLLLNLMPCVLPVLALKVEAFIRQGAATRKASLGRGLAYLAGVVLSFLALAGILLGLKAGGAAIGWGFQFQEPGFVAALAVCFTALALSMLGVFEIGPGAQALAEKGAAGSGATRALLSGALATLAATPCAAPFMGAAIGYALGSGPAETLSVFALLGLGMALPVLALSAFPRLSAVLPKPGRWMETLQRILGFVLLGTVVWLLSILSANAGSGAAIRVMAAALGTALSAWIWGRWGNPAASRPSRAIAGAVALALFAASLGYAILASRNVSRADPPLAPAAAPRDGPRARGIAWEAFSPDGLRRARESGAVVFIDFRADWCLSCVLNEEGVLESGPVVREFAARGVRAFRADWTKADPEVGKALAGYGRRSIPLYVVYPPGAAEPLILPEILTREAVLSALGSAAP